MVPLYDPLDANGNMIANANDRPRMQCNGVLNVICPDRISPVARAIFAELPLPDNPDVVFNNTTRPNQWKPRTPGAWQGVYSIKGDHIATDKLRVSGMFSRQYFDSYPLDWSDSPARWPKPFRSSASPVLAFEQPTMSSSRIC